MSDPAIKLFGRTITLPEIPSEKAEAESGLNARSIDAPLDDGIVRHRSCSASSLAEGSDLNRVGAEQDSAKDRLEGITEGDGGELDSSNEVVDPNGMKETLKAPSLDDIAASTQTEEEQNESSVSHDKAPKKPDKILPCPRCNSLETKFCYYNNYNVNQPRHFCKNCHRYWTAGGTIRNVAVGAGRRKNKNLDSQHRHLSVFETLQNGCKDLANAIHPTLKPNSSLLPSCSDTPLCESMASVLNIAEKAVHDIKRNGFPGPEGLGVSRACGSTANGDNHHSGGSSITTGSSKDEILQGRLAENLVLDIPPHVACFPGAPWPYPRNAVTPLPPTAYCPVGFSMPLLPAAPYWGCSLPGTWNVPWLYSPPATQNETNQTSGPSSPTLGKHSRDDSMMELANAEKDEPLKGSNTEKSLWVPKTLRIVDPEEAAKSSIWSTLGIKNDKVDSVVGGGLLKAFRSKGHDKSNVVEASPLLQANPSALSRSLSFQESSWDKAGEIVKPVSVGRKRREPY